VPPVQAMSLLIVHSNKLGALKKRDLFVPIKFFVRKPSPFRKVRGIVVNVERRHIVCNQIVRIPEDTDYATLPLFLTRNDDLRKLWMKKSPQ
jgi:hypothetical protein